MNNLGVVVLLDKGTNDAKRGEAEVFEGAGFGGGVEEGVEVERDVGVEEELACFGVGGDALEEGKSVADAVGDVCGEVGRDKKAVDGDNLLQQCWHDA